MVDFLGSILLLLLMAAIAIVATILVVAGFIGVGALFTRFTELTLFQATIVTTAVGGAALYLLGRIMRFPVTATEDEWEEEWEDWEDLDFEDMSPEDRRRMIRQLSGIVEYLEELEAEDEDVEPPPPPRRRRRR